MGAKFGWYYKMTYLCSGEVIDYKQIKYVRNDKDARVYL